VGNGSLLVNFDRTYQLRDLYWPHVGQENHTDGHPCRFGVWVDGAFHWVAGEGWHRQLDYAKDTLVTHVTLHHPELQLRMVCHDAVDFHQDVYLRRIDLFDESGRERAVRLFFNQDLHIRGHELGDTAYYEPEYRAVFHYKGKRWFMVNAARPAPNGRSVGVDQWAIGTKEAAGKEGTWRDAEDGQLSGNAVAKGSVDSTVALHLTLPAGGQTTGWYWVTVGDCFRDVRDLDCDVRARGPDALMERTRDYWKLWAGKGEALLDEPAGGESTGRLPSAVRRLYRRSLIILRTQIDHHGGILASCDYDITRHGGDTYAYVWPRDAALVAAALIDAGYAEITRRFFEFCRRASTEEGYLLHKYNPDGSLGSSWHGWYYEGEKRLPIQEDETALVLWALWRHFERFEDVEFVSPLYHAFVCPAADWMVAYRDPDSGLPRPSWGMWEEQRDVFAWTVAATWAGLKAAAKFAAAFGEEERRETYHRAAEELHVAAEKHLWSEQLGRFAMAIQQQPDGTWKVDPRLDTSLTGLWYFDMFGAHDPRVEATMRAVWDRLWVHTEVGGVARYEGDDYFHVSKDVENVPGNPWFICTLWLAQWHIRRAQTMPELEQALEMFHWAVEHALPSGLMSEQVHPYTGELLSASPLTWSHGTLVLAVAEYQAQRKRLSSM
jgi:GH15 family glucan-1,4-alpha-glucosidase